MSSNSPRDGRDLSLPVLATVRITGPCPLAEEAWEPGQKTRHCAECDLDVHNFSALTAAEAAAMVTHSRETGTRLCASLQKDAAGNIITADSRPPRNEEPSPLTRPYFLTRLLATLGILSVPLALAACASRSGGKVTPNSEGRTLGVLRMPAELKSSREPADTNQLAEALKAAQAQRDAQKETAAEQLAKLQKLMGGGGKADDSFFNSTDEPDSNRYFGGAVCPTTPASDTPPPDSPSRKPNAIDKPGSAERPPTTQELVDLIATLRPTTEQTAKRRLVAPAPESESFHCCGGSLAAYPAPSNSPTPESPGGAN